MSKETYTFDDLDDILAEFSSSNTDAVHKPEKFEPQAPSPARSADIKTAVVEETIVVPAINEPKKAPAKKAKAQNSAPSRGNSFEEFEALFSKDSLKKEAAERRATMNKNIRKPEMPKPVQRPAPAPQPKASPVKEERKSFSAPNKQAKPLPKTEKVLPKAVKQPEPLVTPVETMSAEKKKFSLMHTVLSLVFACLSFACLAWLLFNVHPASGSSVSNSSTGAVLKLSDKLDVYMNNVASDALGELAYIKKIYTLQESDTVAPVPNPDNFGRTTDVAVIQDLIKRASHLLDGQSVSFDPSADFVPGEEFLYYLDDTIMVIAWKEYINDRCCTMAEVKIAHGSQLRRKLAEDSYSSSVQYYASDMANASNAVIAINGDFYAFRDLGITVYQRKLYRNNPATVDSCFFTADGDMLFTRAGELMGEGEAQKFIEDNDVVFAVAFGPILVDNGELQYCSSYPIGEIDTQYSRSCIGMTDDLHYLLMTINHTPDARPRATINELARFIYSKGVQKAYTLDGGQTAEIVMFGAPINHVDFGYERTVSDIIYFATAIPTEEGNK